MKKLLGLLAAAVLMPAAANADVLNNVNLIGEIQTIASDTHHKAAPGPGMYATYPRGTGARVLAGLSADLVEDVTANLLFQYANVWGQDDPNGRNMDDYWNSVRLVNANVVLHNLFCCLEATVGRQFYGDEDSAVMYVGPNHYNAVAAQYNGYAKSLDAVKVAYSDDVKAFTMIAGRIREIGDFPALDPAKTYDMYGADFKIKLADEVSAQVYGYDLRDVYGEKDSGFYGAKVNVTPADTLRLSAEYARNFNRHFKEHNKAHGGQGQMLKVDVAADIEAVTARGTFYYANQTFFAVGNYTPGLIVGHYLLGAIGDYSNGEGVALFNAGFDVKPAEKWTVSLDGYSFQDHRMKHGSAWEGDVTVKYAHNENVELFAGVGCIKYAKSGYTGFSKATLDVSDAYKTQLGMLIKF